MRVDTEPLGPQHDLDSFTSGQPPLDGWLRGRALRNQETGDSRTFVVAERGRVTGFYALSTGAAARVGLPGSLRRNAPEPVPLLLLGQLAVDRDWQRRGLGAALLRDACRRAVSALGQVGFRALAAHPIDDAASFYCRFGWTPIPDSRPPLLVLPVQRLLAALAAAG
ncbi:MAG TPA: GNAT family N-acetyltransferase [Acetobacteraceae bacterium]|nr:GNAT family N-acetyltransferase [Acetobacteraceae bacterium]